MVSFLVVRLTYLPYRNVPSLVVPWEIGRGAQIGLGMASDYHPISLQ